MSQKHLFRFDPALMAKVTSFTVEPIGLSFRLQAQAQSNDEDRLRGTFNLECFAAWTADGDIALECDSLDGITENQIYSWLLHNSYAWLPLIYQHCPR